MDPRVSYLLIPAIWANNINKVKSLLESKADPNYENEPLALAILNGNNTIINLLLEFKANLIIPDKYLTNEAANNNINLVSKLLEYKANPNNILALNESAKKGHLGIIKLLIENKANINKDKLLNISSKNQKFHVAKYLLTNKADINNLNENFIKNYMNVTPKNIGFILELNKNFDLSKVKGFDYDKFIRVYENIVSIINELLGKYIKDITLSYL